MGGGTWFFGFLFKDKKSDHLRRRLRRLSIDAIILYIHVYHVIRVYWTAHIIGRISVFDELRGWAFEKGKGGPNERKVTLFTIGTDFLASRLNVTINERNLKFEKKQYLKI